MSEYYTHYLVPKSSSATADRKMVVKAVAEMVRLGFVAPGAAIIVDQVVKGQGRPIEMRLAAGPGEERTISIAPPARSVKKEVRAADPSSVAKLAAKWPEFNVRLAGEPRSARQPMIVGAYASRNNVWEQFRDAQPEIAVHVRATRVRLSRLDSGRNLRLGRNWTEALTAHKQYFDEDWPAAKAPAYFTHPHLGVLKIPDAAVAQFWISISYGKFVVPDPSASSVDVAENEFVQLLADAFKTPFVQACEWG